MHHCQMLALVVTVLMSTLTMAQESATPEAPPPPRDTPVAPFPYVQAKAWHILPGTHNHESGYFSLCEGKDGKLYIGTAKYGENAYLVQFDPATGKQRAVVDTHAVCGLSDTGFAAQAKIHTVNDVGPSGTIYLASKQGYPTKEEKERGATYPGGYLMTYDPASDTARCLGMPFPGQGIIDVRADETRGLVYIVTCEEQHWLTHDLRQGKVREIDPSLRLTPYAITLLDPRGRAHAFTDDFRLARYDPDAGTLTFHDLMLDGQRFAKPHPKAIPTCVIGPDGHTVFANFMGDGRLYRFDLAGEGATIELTPLGAMLDEEKAVLHFTMDIAGDGKLYMLWAVANRTGFGKYGYNVLVSYDPRSGEQQRLGVLAVTNADFFDFSPGEDGKPRKYTHGYEKLPDGVLVPKYRSLALIAGSDDALWCTALYPFTLLRIDLKSLHR